MSFLPGVHSHPQETLPRHGSTRKRLSIVVLCRGSVDEGLGHLHRAASFASRAEKDHDVIVVAIAADAFAPIFAGLRRAPLMVASEDELVESLSATRPDVVVIDMVVCRKSIFAAIRRASPVVACISPIFVYAADVDLFFTRGKAPRWSGLDGPVVHAGRDYTIINRHCAPIRKDAFRRAARSRSLPIMISFGGADADNYSRRVIDVLRDIEAPLVLWLMLGDGYTHSHDELVAAARQTARHEIIMARTNRSMWAVASNCALAVLSGGLSTIEAIYAGLPVISIPRDGDPSLLVEVDYGDFCLHGGDLKDSVVMPLRGLVEDLMANRDKLFALRARQAGVIDGKGVDRVVARIEAHVAGASA